jgi:hypothetical protein
MRVAGLALIYYLKTKNDKKINILDSVLSSN